VEPIRRAVVTGASDGIGASFARALASRGVELVVVARRATRLHELAAAVPVDVEVLPADLADPVERGRVAERLDDPERPIDLLVNAAGFGAYGAVHELPPERLLELVEVDVSAVVALTRAALPRMLERGTGAVVNVGSLAGFSPGPYGAVYGASKAFVGSFTQAVHEELRDTPVHVMLLAPGVIDSGFQAVAGIPDGALPTIARMDAGSVVTAALADLARRRAVCIPGTLNKAAAIGSRVAPAAVTRRASALVHRRYTRR
jgi:uncharacterized protein